MVASGMRHLMFTIRKSEICDCGCGGQCTLAPLFEGIAWSAKSLANGQWPAKKHNLEGWDEEDTYEKVRSDYADTPLGFKAVCVSVKLDWAELVNSIGMTSWEHGTHPCPFCFCPKDELGHYKTMTPLAVPHAAKTSEHYDAACKAAEIRLNLSSVDILLIRPKLTMEKRKGQSRGRVLIVDVPTLGLKKGDRLEPSAGFPDICNFGPSQAPRATTFWRIAGQTMVRWRNPLFQEGTGIGVEDCGIDWLHGMSTGVLQHLLGNFVRSC
jgi:hypothetical protein